MFIAGFPIVNCPTLNERLIVDGGGPDCLWIPGRRPRKVRLPAPHHMQRVNLAEFWSMVLFVIQDYKSIQVLWSPIFAKLWLFHVVLYPNFWLYPDCWNKYLDEVAQLVSLFVISLVIILNSDKTMGIGAHHNITIRSHLHIDCQHV